VQLTRIYTRGGDKGQTSLGTGQRVAKHDLRVTAYGTVDEANACIGLARLHTEGDVDAILGRIQNDLFDVGADLCVPDDATPEAAGFEGARKHALRVADSQVSRLEAEIDAVNAKLQPLKSFILPGGSAAAAHLHLARTVVRRAERYCTELAETEPVNEQAIVYLNRVSDLLFVLARHVNDDGRSDVLWVPGAHR